MTGGPPFRGQQIKNAKKKCGNYKQTAHEEMKMTSTLNIGNKVVVIVDPKISKPVAQLMPGQHFVLERTIGKINVRPPIYGSNTSTMFNLYFDDCARLFFTPCAANGRPTGMQEQGGSLLRIG